MLRTLHQSIAERTISFAVVCRNSTVKREDASGINSLEKLGLGLALLAGGGEAEDARANRGPLWTTLPTLSMKLWTICFSKRLIQTYCSKEQSKRAIRLFQDLSQLCQFWSIRYVIPACPHKTDRLVPFNFVVKNLEIVFLFQHNTLFSSCCWFHKMPNICIHKFLI